MVDRAHLRQLYSALSDAELRRIWRTELVSEARAVLQEELSLRGITVPSLPASEVETVVGNPYRPPAALLADPKAEAVLSARGLVRLFQYLVIASTLIGILLWVLVFVPLPVNEDAMAMRNAAGFDAVDPMVTWMIALSLQALFVLCAFGLCFFKWWARWLYAGAYAAGLLNSLVSGTTVWFAWEAVLFQITTLMDGAIITLAFLPPLARYFEADRIAT